jgi:hypothetical protein
MPHNLEQIARQTEHETLVLQLEMAMQTLRRAALELRYVPGPRDARSARRLVDFDGTEIVVR